MQFLKSLIVFKNWLNVFLILRLPQFIMMEKANIKLYFLSQQIVVFNISLYLPILLNLLGLWNVGINTLLRLVSHFCIKLLSFLAIGLLPSPLQFTLSTTFQIQSFNTNPHFPSYFSLNLIISSLKFLVLCVILG